MSTTAAPPEPDNMPTSDTLSSIEFTSPGRFSIYNPELHTAPTAVAELYSCETFHNIPSAHAHLLALLQNAKRQVLISSYVLFPALYDNQAIARACQQFLLSSPHAKLHILLQDSTRLVNEGHALLELSRKLSSRMSIKLLNIRASEPLTERLITDELGIFSLKQLKPLHGCVHFSAAASARRHTLAFTRAWEQSLSDLNLRSFLL